MKLFDARQFGHHFKNAKSRAPVHSFGTPVMDMSYWRASPLNENGTCLNDSIPNVTEQSKY
jgi:hypothetical protein